MKMLPKAIIALLILGLAAAPALADEAVVDVEITVNSFAEIVLIDDTLELVIDGTGTTFTFAVTGSDPPYDPGARFDVVANSGVEITAAPDPLFDDGAGGKHAMAEDDGNRIIYALAIIDADTNVGEWLNPATGKVTFEVNEAPFTRRMGLDMQVNPEASRDLLGDDDLAPEGTYTGEIVLTLAPN